MIGRLIDAVRRWVSRPARGGYLDREGPPRRLGCIDVYIYAEPHDADDVEFLQHVEQLKSIQRQGRTPPIRLQEYFADRYLARNVTSQVGCSFEVYLEHPLLVEFILADRAAESRAPPENGTPRRA